MRTDAAMNAHRFETPLSIDDRFETPPIIQSGNLDISRIVSIAEEKGYRQGQLIEKKVKSPNSHEPCNIIIANRVLEILLCKRYRKGSRNNVQEVEGRLIEQILGFINNNEPIELVLSFFGAKVRNPLKTYAHEGSEVDISEMASLLRFYEIACAIKSIYPPGATFKIACDGEKYSSAIGFDASEGLDYFHNLQMLCAYMGIDDTVILFNESDYYPRNYLELSDKELERLNGDLENGRAVNEARLITQLQASMVYSMPVPPNIDFKTLLLAFSFNIPDERLMKIDRGSYDYRMWMYEESLKRSTRYIAVYNVAKEHGAIEEAAPHALRATVHPKPGQIGLYSTNSNSCKVFPHHGQGMCKEGSASGFCLENVRVRFKADIERCIQTKYLQGISLCPEKYPFSNGQHPFTFVTQ